MKEFPTSYRALTVQSFEDGLYKIVPVRLPDRKPIMRWRNEQIYHLRQAKPLTTADQDYYFNHVVKSLFEEENPSQILFSFLKGDECIGYGGLVHINWVDRHAEISFIMATELEEQFFESIWSVYLSLIEKVGFSVLNFHKLFVYAFDLRPQLYRVLEKNSYFQDARLKDHCFFQGSFKDVVIHSKLRD